MTPVVTNFISPLGTLFTVTILAAVVAAFLAHFRKTTLETLGAELTIYKQKAQRQDEEIDKLTTAKSDFDRAVERSDRMFQQLTHKNEQLQLQLECYGEERDKAIELLAECLEVIAPLANGRKLLILSMQSDLKLMPAEARKRMKTLERRQEFERVYPDKEAIGV